MFGCFGFNSQYRAHFDDGRLRVTGVDAEGEIRIVELEGHPVFIATLFQPEMSALSGIKNPLITALAQMAVEAARWKGMK